MIPFPKMPAYRAPATSGYEELFRALMKTYWREHRSHAHSWEELMRRNRELRLEEFYLSLAKDETVSFYHLEHFDAARYTYMNSPRAFLGYVARWSKCP